MRAKEGLVQNTYTAFSLDDGQFTSDEMWEGTYEIYAQQNGFVRARLGNFTVSQDEVNEISTQENPFTLIQQVGDFLINEGAQFSDDRDHLRTVHPH